MTSTPTYFGGGPIFDGQSLKQGLTARFEGGQLVALLPDYAPETQGRYVDLGGDILSPGYLDLQVNGGDGIMLNAEPSCAGLARIAKAHRRLGAVQILPTLITDTAEKTAQVIAAAAQAIKAGVPGIAGLHLEGPHLAQSRKGAHDAALIREMTLSDLELLIAAAEALPVLMVTLAPESVSLDQIKTLRDAGVLLSLGHSDASYEQTLEYAEAGVCCVTHLFNAMSPLNHRAPGLVGAALSSPALHAGLIADGIHVHPAAMRAAWAAKMGRPSPEGKIYLVSDAMAPAGSDISAFKLEGRQILRQNGRLTLEDGTLAGADLDLTTALRVLVSQCGIPLEEALTAAVTVPRQVIGQWSTDSCALGLGEDEFIRIQSDLGAATPINETAGL
ncbi:N-acetylglucosamine-6-phosphate deacetylase [Phaeobacter sp. 11ANDIMAR09]|uniref:N-acetylglucosamine-6-phosphate deacetylase n=1 Tax=Phaeobacter sp. 11ANDIMAR09 TaxID=1225647 RepID=UPI0006C8DB3B|nr:N-acetylglucosamine-6-phosphate deacetylase [Phaeobacter sp. 11ANDIMAR09]KPD13934.1 N-acetylglucosamine-6-phosphate deacetylase [Phaeobacter sp. 11ANDIMAR09]